MNALFRQFFVLTESSETGFGLFSAAHFLWLAICAAVILSAGFRYKKASPRARGRMRLAAASLALAVELMKTVFLLCMGEYGIGRLPLHLCGLSVYMIFVHSLRARPANGVFSQFLYAFCMPGAVFALIFPDWTGYPLFSFMTFAGFLLHMLIVLYVITLLFGKDLVPSLRRLPVCILIMLLICVPVYFFDRFTHTNYMFLNWPSPGSPLEWFSFLGRPGYLLGYIPMALLTWAVLYLPFSLRRAAD